MFLKWLILIDYFEEAKVKGKVGRLWQNIKGMESLMVP